MQKTNKTAHIEVHCVACGSCVKVCPVGALSVYQGILAVADDRKCIGCGKCAKLCPAQAIIMTKKGGESA